MLGFLKMPVLLDVLIPLECRQVEGSGRRWGRAGRTKFKISC